jgi:cell division protein FtsQ
MDRLRRFIAVWPRVHEQIDIDIKTADLRYASGFALTPVDASVLQQPVAPAARKGRK